MAQLAPCPSVQRKQKWCELWMEEQEASLPKSSVDSEKAQNLPGPISLKRGEKKISTYCHCQMRHEFECIL